MTTTATKIIPVAFPNKGDRECVSCKADVADGAGYSFKRSYKWFTICASTACAEAAYVTLPDTRRRMLADGTVRTPYEPQNLPLIRALPGARWNEPVEGCWNFDLAPAHRERVLEIGEQLGLDIEPSLRKFSLGRAVANLVKRGAAAGLYPFQLKGVEYLASHKRCFLGDDMGLGKTIQSLMCIENKGRALVICPQNVKFNWRDEVLCWRPDLTPRVVSGRQKTVAGILPKAGEIVIINYDILPADAKPTVPSGKKNKKGKDILIANLTDAVKAKLGKVTLIVDEAHRAKNYKAQRSQKLTQISKLAGRVIGMSGTPLVNRPPDLFGTLCALDMSYEVFGGWKRFVSLFGGYDNGFGLSWPDYRHTPVKPEAAERMRRIMLRRTKAEVLPELPAKQYKTIAVNGLSKKTVKVLDSLLEEWGDVLDAGELPPFEAMSEIRAQLAKDRIDAVTDMVVDFEDAEKPVLVFSAHRAPVEALGAREGWATIIGGMDAEARQNVVKSFQAGELKVLALTIKAGCEGLTLTKAADVIFVDLDWVPSLNSQAEDRVCRIGQTADAITITRLVSDHALDKRVLDLLADKTAMIEQTLVAKVEVEVPQYAVVKAESIEDMNARLAVNDAAELARREAIAAAAAEAERAAWQTKVERIHERQVARAEAAGAKLADLTPERVEQIKGSYRYMLSVCDGAKEKDFMGFNKPDACMARILMAEDLNDKFTQQALYAILTRYHRQLSDSFPLLFGEK
jgi:hypothetical protein